MHPIITKRNNSGIVELSAKWLRVRTDRGALLAAAEASVRGPMRLLTLHAAVGRVPAAVVDRLRLALPAPLLLLHRGDLLSLTLRHFCELFPQRIVVLCLDFVAKVAG